jgi:hypothetical protein
MKKDLQVKPLHLTFINELSDSDMDRYYEACDTLPATFESKESCLKVLLTDECTIYCSYCMRNVVFWAKQNPHFMMELEHNPPHMILSLGETVTCMIGPYFLTGLLKLPCTKQCWRRRSYQS